MNSIYQALAELESEGRSGVLCTIISTQGSTPRDAGSKMLVYPNGEIVGTIGGGEVEHRAIRASLEALKEKKTRILKYSMVNPERGDPGVCGGQLEIFIEPILPRHKLVVVGGGHVGKAVVELGKWLEYHVILYDDRPEFSTVEAVPDADEFFSGSLSDISKYVEITPSTCFVLTTRNVKVDLEILPILLESEAMYVGVIGSRRRWETTKRKLLEAGFPLEKINRIYSPIGLELQAETPREIALSILAEIIMVHNQASAVSMSGHIQEM